jgi:hypothetical protein
MRQVPWQIDHPWAVPPLRIVANLLENIATLPDTLIARNDELNNIEV